MSKKVFELDFEGKKLIVEAGEIAKIADLMKEINAITVDKKVKRGDVVAQNIVGTDVNLIATATIY